MNEEVDIANDYGTTEELLTRQLETAVQLLSGWCGTVRDNGSGWDEHYNNAAYRINCIRELIDAAMPPEPENL